MSNSSNLNQIKIVYWSGTGNTQSMAELVGEGVKAQGKEAVVISVDAANAEELKEAGVFALGCPSMGAEQLEEEEMEPFMAALENGIGGKQIGLFGSYGWGNEEWMRDWETRITAAGATVVGGSGVAVNGAPEGDGEQACKDLGKALADLA